MIDKTILFVLRFAARCAAWEWITICIICTAIILFICDWSVMSAGWVQLRAADVPIWMVLEIFALTWARNITFWLWLAGAGFVAWRIWHAAIKRYP